jgi:hypothetical protein
MHLEYNTERNKLILSEYGRNIQKMVEVASNEQDPEKRVRIASELIQLMGQLNPHLRDIADYKHKLWDHLFIMSEFGLEVDSPYPKPTPETINTKPDQLDYPQHRIRFKFYGNNISNMIEKVAVLEDGPFKIAYINAIGSFMKMSSKLWNDEVLTDEEVLQHLNTLSGGRINITIEEGGEIQFSSVQIRRPPQQQQRGQNQQQGRFRPQQGQNRNRPHGGKGNSGGGGQNYRNFKGNKNRPHS